MREESSGWTPEQLENANKYGLCPHCRSPRKPGGTYDADGRLVAVGVTCDCGRDPDADFDQEITLPALDLDRTLVTVMVPTAPRTTYSTSAPDPTHVPMTVSLRQIADAIKEADRG